MPAAHLRLFDLLAADTAVFISIPFEPLSECEHQQRYEWKPFAVCSVAVCQDFDLALTPADVRSGF